MADNSAPMDTTDAVIEEGCEGEEHTVCEVCKEKEKRYKCPRCSLFTCSLDCCVKHKAQSGCNGKRDRASFVSMSGFQEKHIRNDFHFLEDVLQTKGTAERTLSSMNESALRVRRDNVFYRQKQLVKAALSRGITLNMLPRGMAKSALNTTKFYNKNNKLQWRVHFVFAIAPSFLPADLLSPDLHNCQSITSRTKASQNSSSHIEDPDSTGDAGSGRVFAVLRKKRPIDAISPSGRGGSAGELQSPASVGALVGVCADAIDENATLRDLINNCINSSTARGSVLAHTLRSLRPHAKAQVDSKTSEGKASEGGMDVDTDNNSDAHPLPLPLLCLIQTIPSPAARPVFQEIPLDFSIKEALQGKTILEFPTFVVSTAANLQQVERAIATFDRPAENINTMDVDPVLDGSGNTILTPTLISGVSGLECYGSDEDEDGDTIGEGKGVRHVKKKRKPVNSNSSSTSTGEVGPVPSPGGTGGGSEAEAAAEEQEERDFLSALQEFESADPEVLKAYIAAEEAKQNEEQE
jgi:hypothetical protein